MVGIAQHRQIRGEARERLGDDVEMLARLQRRADAAALRQRPRPEAGREHDDVRRDLALIRHDASRALAVGLYRRHFHVLEHARAAHRRALDQRHRRVDRIGLAVVGQKDAAGDVVDIQQRPLALDLRGADLVHLESEGLRHRRAALQLFQPLGICGDRNAAALQEAGRLAGLRFQAGIEARRILRELGQIGGRAQLADQTRGVPGRAAGQALALQQHDVALAELGQMVGDRSADHAAADDDDFGVRGQGFCHRGSRSTRQGKGWRGVR